MAKKNKNPTDVQPTDVELTDVQPTDVELTDVQPTDIELEKTSNLEAIAQQVFESYPNIDTVYVCVDGNPFLSEDFAVAHHLEYSVFSR